MGILQGMETAVKGFELQGRRGSCLELEAWV